MDLGSCTSMIVLHLILNCFCLEFGASIDTISSSQFIRDPETIVSAGKKFELGFFSPVNSTNRYVAIWYSNISITTPVWVANRKKPLNDSSGIMTISEDGNLVVLNGQQDILWSSNVSTGMNDSRAQLMDDGNLVLGGSENGNSLWQSFQEPSDTYIPQMRLAANSKTGKKTLLTSWKSPSDPSIGSFSLGIDPSSIPEIVLWNDSRPIWRTGPWNGQVFIGVPEMNSVYLDGFNLADDGNGGFTLSVVFADESYITNFVLSSEGKFGQVDWDDTNKGSWRYQWESVQDECDVYGKCGSFASCDAKNSPICSCLKGFEPKNADEWNSRNWTNGCVRRKAMRCERIQNGGELGKEDGFLKLERVKVPDFAEWSSSITEQKCRYDCWNNCSCVAYAYYTGIYCMLWRGNLTDIKMFSSGGADLYIRLAYTELDNKKINLKVIISLTVVVGAIAIAICVFYSWRWIERKRTSKKVLLPKRKDPILSDENAWKLWNEGNIAALVDPGISYPSFREEIFRCVHVGLLCVQEFAKDRPAIFTIISMLNSEIVDLPTPKQPAFSERRSELDTASLQHDRRPESVNNVTAYQNPSIGSISGGIDPSRIPQFYIWNGSRPIWRTGPWNGQVFIGIPEMVSVYLDGFNIADEGNGTFTLSVGFANESLISNYILSSEGKFGKVVWDDTEGSWRYEWNFPKDECDIYGKCGSFGSCNPQDSPICSCLKGFEPKNADEWNNGNWTNGCVRRRELQCERTQNGGQVGKEDGFLKLERMKVPDFSEWLSSTSEQTCKNECLNINCSCIAYSYYPGFGCMLWRGNLTDLKKFPIKAADLYIRLADSELDNKKINLKVIISLTVVVGAIAIAICVFYSWRRIDRKRKSKKVFLSKRKAWRLWNEGNIAALVDHGISYPSFREEIFRCVHVGLLCVQEFAKDRPAIFTVISMLNSEIADLPAPKQPAFSERRSERDTESPQHDRRPESINNVTVFVWNDSRPLWRSGPWNGQAFIGIPEMNSVYINGYNLVQDGDGTFSLSVGLANESYITNFALSYEGRFGEIYWDSGNERWEHKKQYPGDDCDIYGKCGPFGFCNTQNSPICREKLTDIRKFSSGGANLYVRLADLEFGKNRDKKAVISITVVTGAIIIAAGAFFWWKWMAKYRERKRESERILSSRRKKGYPAWKLWNEGNTPALVDPALTLDQYSKVEILRCIHVGLLCVQEFAKDRPAISTIISMDVRLLVTPETGKFSVYLKNMTRFRNFFFHCYDAATETITSSQPIKDPETMRLSANARTRNKTLLMSWRSSSDPSVGNFSAGINPLGVPEFFMWYNDHPFWRSGPWVGHNFIGIPDMSISVYLSGFTLQDEGDGTFTMSLIVDPANRLTYVLTSHGRLTEQSWDYGKQGWEYTWEAPSTDCDIYGKCGSFGSCDTQNSPVCTCLKGFVAKNQDEWNKGIWTSGCVRRTSLQCDRIQNDNKRNMKVIISMSVIVGAIAICICVFLSWKWMATHRERKLISEETLSFKTREAQGTAWKLWNEGDITALVDPAISDPCFQVEIFRCIQIGLLCVQEVAKDRPAVSTISSMLNSEIVDLPPPKKPAFVERHSSVDTESITQNQKINSINNVTISDLNGR
ncbi:hypothetical protein NC653_027171 [Populus alba x Populus x berolinensis]|uniref:non-specific serine/threonine protein kinase n=1 Tax=Populus alba x Populus x berolinensis TaxID=444605 RepID=A0AAD6Q4S4_9ROSI|nr:hypothetical protein NC653_027171 [Populus alba x Populus x berolinensis]